MQNKPRSFERGSSQALTGFRGIWEEAYSEKGAIRTSRLKKYSRWYRLITGDG